MFGCDMFQTIPRNISQLRKREMFKQITQTWAHPTENYDEVYIAADAYRESPIVWKLPAPYGQLDPSTGFAPAFTPPEMLRMGIFEGRYLNSLFYAFPRTWWDAAQVSIHVPDIACNRFGIKARSSLQEWHAMGSLRDYDPRGWFEWYCFYFLGRRIVGYDDWQIKRWKNLTRHVKRLESLLSVLPDDMKGKPTVYPKMRQTVFQWSYDPLVVTAPR